MAQADGPLLNLLAITSFSIGHTQLIGSC